MRVAVVLAMVSGFPSHAPRRTLERPSAALRGRLQRAPERGACVAAQVGWSAMPGGGVSEMGKIMGIGVERGCGGHDEWDHQLRGRVRRYPTTGYPW